MDSLPAIFIEAVHKHLIDDGRLDENLQHLSSYWGLPKTLEEFKELNICIDENEDGAEIFTFLHELPLNWAEEPDCVNQYAVKSVTLLHGRYLEITHPFSSKAAVLLTRAIRDTVPVELIVCGHGDNPLSPRSANFLNNVPRISSFVQIGYTNPEIIPFIIKAIELGTLDTFVATTQVSHELGSAFVKWILCRNFRYLKVTVLHGSPVEAKSLFDWIYDNRNEVKRMKRRKIGVFSYDYFTDVVEFRVTTW